MRGPLPLLIFLLLAPAAWAQDAPAETGPDSPPLEDDPPALDAEPAPASPDPALTRRAPDRATADALATYAARRLQRGMFFGSVETWGTGLLFWHGAGAGPLRRQRLVEAFGTVEAIRAADPAEVAEAGRYRGPEPYRLHRVDFLQTQLGRPTRGGVVVPSSWNVLDGYGAPMSPRTLALRVGAYDVLERIDHEAEALLALWVGASIATAVLVGAGTFELRATASAEAYPAVPPPVLARQAALRRRRGSAMIVLGAAISTAASSAATTTAVMHTKLVTFWTEDALDQVIQRYNEGLQDELGITAEDVARYVGRRGVAPRVLVGPNGVLGEF